MQGEPQTLRGFSYIWTCSVGPTATFPGNELCYRVRVPGKSLLHFLQTRPRAQAPDCSGEPDRGRSQAWKHAGKVLDGAGAYGGWGREGRGKAPPEGIPGIQR